MNELNHGPGKGDKDRSPGWRKEYDEINMHRETPTPGFSRVGPGRIRKVYGAGNSAGVSLENWDSGEVEEFRIELPSPENLSDYLGSPTPRPACPRCGEAEGRPICKCGAVLMQRIVNGKIEYRYETHEIYKDGDYLNTRPIEAPCCTPAHPRVTTHIDPAQSGRSVQCDVPPVPENQVGDSGVGISGRIVRVD